MTRLRLCSLLLASAIISLLSCFPKEAERGRPEALAPIFGARGIAAARPRTKPSEPVEETWIDLGALLAAWPNAGSELPTLLQAVLARGTWIDEHHVATTMETALKVRHRPDVVLQAKRLVKSLEARLVWPLQIHVAFVEVGDAAASRVLPHERGERRWSAEAFRLAAQRNEARTLARVVLTTTNGQWAVSDRVSNQVYLSGVTIVDGAISPQTVTLASGYTIQGAAWRWGEERAVVALTGLVTGEASAGQSVTQTVHRELPRKKKNETEWEEHDVKLDLPVRELLELRDQLTVRRGEWTVAAVLPRDRKRLSAVIVKVDWQSPVPRMDAVQASSSKGYQLEVIPVALPADVSSYQATQQQDFDNRRDISANAAGWFKNRAKGQQEEQKRTTYNFQSESGSMDFDLNPAVQAVSRKARARSRGGNDSPSGVMPEALEKLRAEVLQAEWPDGTALEFVANHVFVVHRAEMTAKVRRLLDQTHDWRNRRVLVDVTFPVISASAADQLGDAVVQPARAATLRRGETLLPPALLAGRGGSWAEFFVAEMHSVLSAAWSPDRSSPSVLVYWKGARLAVQPQLATGRSQGLDLRWRQHRLEKTAPQTVAGAILQQPADSLWSHQQTLQLASGTSLLAGMVGEGGKMQALLVAASTR
jgi:hypothetical protein